MNSDSVIHSAFDLISIFIYTTLLAVDASPFIHLVLSIPDFAVILILIISF
jgi:hypothetical protein